MRTRSRDFFLLFISHQFLFLLSGPNLDLKKKEEEESGRHGKKKIVVHQLTENGELSVGPDGLGESPRAHLALVLGVVVQRSVLDADVMLALLFAAHDSVARKRRNGPFETCPATKKNKQKERSG